MSGHTPRWYCVQNDGKALLCRDEEHAKLLESQMTHGWPPIKIYKAVLLMDAEEMSMAWGALGACRDAFPVPPIGGANEHPWQQAMAHPKAVPDYVRACVAVHTELLAECKATLQELGHLADGEQCTLIRLKRAVEKITGEKL